ILVIGISLMRVGVGWVMGGPASSSQVVDVSKLVTVVEKYRSEQDAYEKGKENLSNIATNDASVLAKPPPKMAPIPMMDRPGYAAISNMMISLFVLVFIVLVLKFFKGFVANIAVLLGIVAGMVVSAINGTLNLTKVFEADAIGVINLFNFGAPTLDPFLIITVSLVMVVVFVESAGMYVAVSDITHKKISNHELSSGLRVNGFGTFLGGMLNTFPFTSFSQNVGLVEVTRVYSRWVCVVGGLILMFLGLLPKMGALVESIPQFVLGGAGVVMFGMVAASGIRILSTVDFATNRFNLYIMAISVGMGLIPLIAPRWTQHLPSVLQPILDSGILLAAIVSIFLNLLFNGLQTSDENLGLPEKIQDHF
ncbi:MAG: solute carrier family 23 protein, partial [Gammaproteobacteria bacterium]|nr:solute carrier family 23 protein [Gammaproteobacteria bacterium]